MSATLNFELLHSLRVMNPIHDNFRYELVVEELEGLFGKGQDWSIGVNDSAIF